ncbi:hypothetical protein STA3757_31670 [Stanieria sp. NIES-3757]|nr:hypothetical protein STA3757_31670 [Stanieria sp. NIES-3757]
MNKDYLKYEFQKSRDLLDKLEREYKRLKDAINSQDQNLIADSIFNFAVTAYHIKDWLKEEKTDKSWKTAVEKYVHDKDNDKDENILSICGDICNSSKHRYLNSPNKSNATNIQNSSIKVSKDQITVDSLITINGYTVYIELNSGEIYEILSFANQVIKRWQDFFINNSIS